MPDVEMNRDNRKNGVNQGYLGKFKGFQEDQKKLKKGYNLFIYNPLR